METQFSFKMKDHTNYVITKVFANAHNKWDSWPVELFNEDDFTITIEPVDADKDEVIEFVKLLEMECQNLAKAQPELAAYIAKWNYVLEGSTEDNFGDCVAYRIERSPTKISIQETDPFSFRGSMYYGSYEDFVAEFGELCEEGEFDTDYELAVTSNRVFFDEFPPYGEKKSLDESQKSGSFELTNDDIIAYLEKNKIPYDENTLNNLSINDIYAIMGGTYGK